MFKKSSRLPLKPKEYVPPAHIKCVIAHDFLDEGVCDNNCLDCKVYQDIVIQELFDSWDKTLSKR